MVRTHPDPPFFIGGVAQLGERMLCKHEVIGSIPFTSTNSRRESSVQGLEFYYLPILNTQFLSELIGCIVL
jgi:hypothetical protein